MTEEQPVELVEEGAAPRARLGIGNPFYLLAGVMLLLAFLICSCATLIYFNPYNPLNPYKPPTPRGTEGATATSTVTPQPTRLAEASPTPSPTPTPFASPTPELPATPASVADVRFMAEISASPQTLSGRTCEDNSIAGEVKDRDNNPVVGYTIEVSRVDGFRVAVISGSKPEYGASGWEVLLVNDQGTPEPLHAEYTVRLFDSFGVEVANPIPPGPQTRTSNNCGEGVIYIVYREIPTE